jgi:16S rRNA (uracil1498-N3)-methyltransferase
MPKFILRFILLSGFTIIVSMRYVYIPEAIQGDEYAITDPDHVHHLGVVGRARSGEAVALFDPYGQAYYGLISRISKNEVIVKVESRPTMSPPRVHLTVACALPKASGIEGIIDNLTQLGVEEIIPMLTERVVARPDETTKKLERWKKIALSAAEQSQRNNLPAISPLLSLEEVIRQTADYNLKMIPTLEGRNDHLSQVIKDFTTGNIVVLIGPEGDFTPREVKTARQAGFIGVSLGHNVLRVDTAAAAVSAVIKLAIPDPG